MRGKEAIHFGLAIASLIFGLGTQQAAALVSVAVQPPSQVSLVGSNAVFTAQTTTSAGETGTGYTWLMSTNDENPFITIAGATTPICTVTHVQTSNARDYFVKGTYKSRTNT